MDKVFLLLFVHKKKILSASQSLSATRSIGAFSTAG